jgi:hypothetical protein
MFGESFPLLLVHGAKKVPTAGAEPGLLWS